MRPAFAIVRDAFAFVGGLLLVLSFLGMVGMVDEKGCVSSPHGKAK